ncbi:MAG: hypothetical protein A6F71_01400 [Cycloclasticus sp. symbiont of Poecilosclerida sp. M]|nr:MAG: hypothetical protein A6F71_01400 [Cycloclasticus sp. symbiont of Poecilosclerida sp. M]
MFKLKTLTLLLSLIAFAPQSFAHRLPMMFAEAAYINLDQAVHRVKQKHPAKVLGAKTVQIKGEAVHVVKILTKAGRVKKIRVHSSPKKHP